MPQTHAQTTLLAGTHIRERRLALGLRQAEVAAGAGISASYLNLIEHNRRKVKGEVLDRLAQVLGVETALLAEGAGGALVDDLRAAAAAAPTAGAELDRIEDFAGRFPGWAAVLVATQARAGQLERLVAALNDRITHDPHLSASLHEVLSALSSVRSTAAILAETEDIDPEWRARFHRNLHQDSERLASGAEALVAYLDRSENDEDQDTASPQEEVEGWLADRGWHLAELEQPGGRALLMAEVAGLASAAARKLAMAFITQAEAEGARLPAAVLGQAQEEHGDDPALLADRLGLPVLLVMRRMALRPGSKLGLVICDASGTLLFRKPVEGFALPRFGAACPLWPLFTALTRPMSPVGAVVATSGRSSRLFRALAMCDIRVPQGFDGPELREAGMLLLPLDQPPAGAAVLGVGSSCRICPRAKCPARREPSILSETA
ncbi:helix-turn-helix domain-containing protein [Pseudotabrizicola sp. L79]|uniref:helix-turn-helix domain-containing protein n=1 Tax=Pseudotabrizicola sp. L79 TaxID=3118402 RepID=UPI002F93A3A8